MVGRSGGSIEKALQNMREVVWDKGPVQCGVVLRGDGHTARRWHDSEVAAIGYCPERKVLACTFTRRPGHVYHYPNVEPEFHAAFMAAESKGKFFGANVKPLPFDKFSSETMAEAIKAASAMTETAQA